MFKIEHLVLTVALAAAGGCATAPIPYKTPVSATPPTGPVIVSQAVNVLDSSGSMEDMLFADGRATLESVVAVMPNGNYSAGQIHFGGFGRESTAMAPFNRSNLAVSAKDTAWIEGSTPLADVITTDVGAMIGGGTGRAAVVVISDGRATDFAGREGMGDGAVAAAQGVVSGRKGDTCFHTIQVGNDPAGAATLQAIANVSSCGSFRNASTLSSASALQQFSRDAYLGAAPVVAVIGDEDGDGVLDPSDKCPGTPRGADVDYRGCWTLEGLQFETSSAKIDMRSHEMLHSAIAVLQANPNVRIRIDGHTDSSGSEAYNQDLSERRAASVEEFFVKEGGLSTDRFDANGFGELRPAVPNDSPANMAINRRVELTPLK